MLSAGPYEFVPKYPRVVGDHWPLIGSAAVSPACVRWSVLVALSCLLLLFGCASPPGSTTARAASGAPPTLSCGPPLGATPKSAPRLVERGGGPYQLIVIARDRTVAAATEAGDVQIWEAHSHSAIARILEPGRGSGQGSGSTVAAMRWNDEQGELWIAWGGNVLGCARYDRSGARIGELMGFEQERERAPRDALAAFCAKPRQMTVLNVKACNDGKTSVRMVADSSPDASLSVLNEAGDTTLRVPVPRAGFVLACTARAALVTRTVKSGNSDPHEGIELVPLRAGAQPMPIDALASGRPETFSPDGRTFQAFSYSGDLYVYDAETARPIQTIHQPRARGPSAIGGEPLLVAVGAGQELLFYEAATGRLSAVVGAPGLSTPFNLHFLDDDLLAFGLQPNGHINMDQIHPAPWAVVSVHTGEAHRIEAGALLRGPPVGVTKDGNLLVFRGALETWRGTERLPRAQRYVAGAPWPPPPGNFARVPGVAAEYYTYNDDGSSHVTRRAREAFDFETGRAILDDEHDVLTAADTKTGASIPLKPPHYARSEGQERPEQTTLFAHGTRAYSRWADGIVVWDTESGAILGEGPSLQAFVRASLAKAQRPVPEYLRVAQGEDACNLVAPVPNGKVLVVSCWNDFFFIDLEAHRIERTPISTITEQRAGYWILGASQDEIYSFIPPNRVQRWQRGEPSVSADVGGVTLAQMAASPNGSTLATATTDGRVQIWDGRTLKLRATLAEYDDGEALLFSPHGAYGGTPEVSARVAWVFNRPAESFGFAQFASTFARPDILARRLRGEDIDISEPVRRPPRVDALEVEPHSDGSARVSAHVSADSRVDRVRVFDEGVQVAETSVCAAASDVSLRIPLLRGANRVSLVAYDDHGSASNVAASEVLGAAQAAPSLYLVAVGINEYPGFGEKARLSYAAADASAITRAFHDLAGPGKMYANIAYERVLLDSKADVASILTALQPLERMSPDDIAIVFLAGHGTTVGAHQDMVFVTGDARPDSLSATSVRWADIGQALGKARGRVLVLLDACHSGNVVQDLIVPDERLASDLARRGRAGALVFSAAKGRQSSFEPGNARGLKLEQASSSNIEGVAAHGFFTGAILAALSAPSTDLDGNGAIEISELIDDVTRRVATATNNLQTPWVARKEVVADFRIAPRAQ